MNEKMKRVNDLTIRLKKLAKDELVLEKRLIVLNKQLDAKKKEVDSANLDLQKVQDTIKEIEVELASA